MKALFADLADGVRFFVMVRQGRMGALIQVRSEEWRGLHDAAAGTVGLRVRRLEADEKLRAANGDLQPSRCWWAGRNSVRMIAGADKLRRQNAGLLGYLGRNEAALVLYAARRRHGEPIATSFAKSVVDEIIAWCMTKKQQMR